MDNNTDSSSLNSSVATKHWSRRGLLGLLLAASLTFAGWSAQAAPMMSGTYVTPARQGRISFVGLRAFRGGIEGKFNIDGKSSPGSLYSATGGGTGLVWYYGVSGIMAGNALVTLQPDGTYGGPIWFFDRRGNTTSSGTTTVTFP
jgi:hypothetical protein